MTFYPAQPAVHVVHLLAKRFDLTKDCHTIGTHLLAYRTEPSVHLLTKRFDFTEDILLVRTHLLT